MFEYAPLQLLYASHLNTLRRINRHMIGKIVCLSAEIVLLVALALWCETLDVTFDGAALLVFLHSSFRLIGMNRTSSWGTPISDLSYW